MRLSRWSSIPEEKMVHSCKRSLLYSLHSWGAGTWEIIKHGVHPSWTVFAEFLVVLAPRLLRMILERSSGGCLSCLPRFGRLQYWPCVPRPSGGLAPLPVSPVCTTVQPPVSQPETFCLDNPVPPGLWYNLKGMFPHPLSNSFIII